VRTRSVVERTVSENLWWDSGGNVVVNDRCFPKRPGISIDAQTSSGHYSHLNLPLIAANSKQGNMADSDGFEVTSPTNGLNSSDWRVGDRRMVVQSPESKKDEIDRLPLLGLEWAIIV
jgi:hypothetical protein